MRSIRPLATDAVVASGDFESAPCQDAAARALRYDSRARAMRAARDLAVGAVVETPPAFALPLIRPGERLHVRTVTGPVLVEREVEALQAANPGDRLFVRSGDGAVFSVLLPEARP